MKKFTFLMCAILAGLLKVNAQEPQFVSTEQQKRNVLIEEFTGRMCGFCPYGQAIVNQIVALYPEQVFMVNIHAVSSMSPTSSPNLNTDKGAEVFMAFNAGGGIPAATVNRGKTIHPAEALPSVNAQLGQMAECNVGGKVVIDEATRTATVTVEVYYTSDVTSKSYLTVMMAQDSIFGYQSDYGPDMIGAPYNPGQMIGNQYVHMHTIRDYITETWGEEIAPATAGTLITKTYTYQIPEVIGNPNGVQVDLSDIHFLAAVAKGQRNVPIMNVNNLKIYMASGKEINPSFGKINVKNTVSCTESKEVSIELENSGTQEITSLKYEVEVWGVKTQHSWTGNLPSYSSVTFEEEIVIYLGEHDVKFRITEVNGKPYSYKKEISVNSEGWSDVYFQGEEDEFRIQIVQDKHGTQTTWKLINSNEEVLASGGPYTTLVANGIKAHVTKVKVPNNECLKFVIYDEGNNGINCGYGDGYYQIKDSKGNIIINGDGKFTSEASHSISTKQGEVAVEEITDEAYDIYPNPVKDVLTIEGQNIEQVNVYNAMGQLVKTVNGNDNVVKVNVNDLQNGMYIVNIIDNNGEMSSKKVSVLN